MRQEKSSRSGRADQQRADVMRERVRKTKQGRGDFGNGTRNPGYANHRGVVTGNADVGNCDVIGIRKRGDVLKRERERHRR